MCVPWTGTGGFFIRLPLTLFFPSLRAAQVSATPCWCWLGGDLWQDITSAEATHCLATSRVNAHTEGGPAQVLLGAENSNTGRSSARCLTLVLI